MFTHLRILQCVPTQGQLSLIANTPSNSTSGRRFLGLDWSLAVDGWFTPMFICFASCQTTSYPYSPSSSVGWQWRDLRSSWIIATCQLLMPSLRCQSFVGACWCVVDQNFKLRFALGWSDSAPRCAWTEGGKMKSELGEYCSYCPNKEESDRLWECPGPLRFSLAKRLKRRQMHFPYFQPLCSTMWLSTIFFYSKIWLRCPGKRRILRLIVCLVYSQPNWH